MATTAVFSIITGTILMALDSRKTPAPSEVPAETAAPRDSTLGLNVISRKQQVEIRWNHALPVTVSAAKGILKISEGETTELVNLDRRDLQDGFVAYTPSTNDVSIRLDVIAADGSSVSESARVIAIP